MLLVRRQPDRVDGRHDPDTVLDPDRQQPAQRAEQLAARMAMRARRQLLALAALGRDQDRAILSVDQAGEAKNGIGHGG